MRPPQSPNVYLTCAPTGAGLSVTDWTIIWRLEREGAPWRIIDDETWTEPVQALAAVDHQGAYIIDAFANQVVKTFTARQAGCGFIIGQDILGELVTWVWLIVDVTTTSKEE